MKRFTIGSTGQRKSKHANGVHTGTGDRGGGGTAAGVTVHAVGCANGHYTTYVRKGRVWYHADDGAVSETTEEEASASGEEARGTVETVQMTGDGGAGEDGLGMRKRTRPKSARRAAGG